MLILEDDEVLRGLLVNWLETEGHGVCGLDLEPLPETLPDVALVDLHGGEVDGWTAAEVLIGLGVRVVIMTGANGEEMLARAESLGVAGWLSKPFSLDQVREALEGTLSR